jgi:AcrR family transcriptional regulator
VEDLLDAADALIAEVGVAEASVQEIARRAGASIGSLYHFFPTRDAVIEALRARYRSALDATTDHLRERADEWARLPLPEFVDALLAPFAAFLDQHPGFIAVAAAPGGDEARVPDALRIVLSRRNPALSAVEHALRASVFAAVIGSVTALMLHASRARREALFREMTRVAVGYLAAGEPAPAGKSTGKSTGRRTPRGAAGRA